MVYTCTCTYLQWAHLLCCFCDYAISAIGFRVNMCKSVTVALVNTLTAIMQSDLVLRSFGFASLKCCPPCILHLVAVQIFANVGSWNETAIELHTMSSIDELTTILDWHASVTLCCQVTYYHTAVPQRDVIMTRTSWTMTGANAVEWRLTMMTCCWVTSFRDDVLLSDVLP